MEFELGQTYSGYQFLEHLGNSRNAVEYRVCNVLAQRQEMLKVVAAFARDDRDSTEALLREARILARVSHPHIIDFYTAQPIQGRMALTTELPESVTLAVRLQSGAFPLPEALSTALQILSAISCLHRQNILHLNITPESILCGVRGEWKLADFAMARVVNGVPVTSNGTVSGNLRYISPEQVKGTVLDHRSDLYSFGVVLYEILCGRPPFDSKSQFELMLAHVNQPPEAPSRVNPFVPEPLDVVLSRALAKNPADRYESADALESAIAGVVERIAQRTPVAAEVRVPFDAAQSPASGQSFLASSVHELAPAAGTAAFSTHEIVPEAAAVTAISGTEKVTPATVDDIEQTGAETSSDLPELATEEVAPERSAPRDQAAVPALSAGEIENVRAEASPVSVDVGEEVPATVTAVPDTGEVAVAPASDLAAIAEGMPGAITARSEAEEVAAAPVDRDPLRSTENDVEQEHSIAASDLNAVVDEMPAATAGLAAENVAMTPAERTSAPGEDEIGPVNVGTAPDLAAPVEEPPAAVKGEPAPAETVSDPTAMEETSGAVAPALEAEEVAVASAERVAISSASDGTGQADSGTASDSIAVADESSIAVAATSVIPEVAVPAEAASDLAALVDAATPMLEAEEVAVAPAERVAVSSAGDGIGQATSAITSDLIAVAGETSIAVAAVSVIAEVAAAPADRVVVHAAEVEAAPTEAASDPATIPKEMGSEQLLPSDQAILVTTVDAIEQVLLEETPARASSVPMSEDVAPSSQGDLAVTVLEGLTVVDPVQVSDDENLAAPATGLQSDTEVRTSADPEVQASLWAAATIVAQAAAAQSAVRHEPVIVVPVTGPKLPEPEAVVPVLPAAEPDYQIKPALAARNRNDVDAFHWIMFGSSAAFLGIVLIAIFFSLR